jgi:hypothetical protein
MLEGFSPEFLKGTGLLSLTLTAQQCLNNYQKGIETTVILGLNIIGQMRRVIKNKIAYANSGLDAMVTIT